MKADERESAKICDVSTMWLGSNRSGGWLRPRKFNLPGRRDGELFLVGRVAPASTVEVDGGGDDCDDEGDAVEQDERAGQ